MKFLQKHRGTFVRLMGLMVFIITLHSLYFQQITWMYEGLIGTFIGTLLFWMPEEIIKLALSVIKAVTKKLLNEPKSNDVN